MAQMTVAQFATELKVEPGRLLEQLKAAGVDKSALEEALSEHDKSQLLDYLHRMHGGAEPRKRITLTRRETTEMKQADSTGRSRTIQVEVRKKRVFVKRDAGAPGEGEVVAEAELPLVPVEEPVVVEPVAVVVEPGAGSGTRTRRDSGARTCRRTGACGRSRGACRPGEESVPAPAVASTPVDAPVVKPRAVIHSIGAEQIALRQEESRRHAELMAPAGRGSSAEAGARTQEEACRARTGARAQGCPGTRARRRSAGCRQAGRTCCDGRHDSPSACEARRRQEAGTQEAGDQGCLRLEERKRQASSQDARRFRQRRLALEEGGRSWPR